MNRIEQLRKERGMSQQDLAKHFNVHQTAVSQWETERTRPSFEMVMDLAVFFDVNAAYLLGQTEKRGHFSEPEPDDEYVDPDAPTTPLGWLIDIFQRSNSSGQQLIISVAEAIAGNPACAADYPGSPAHIYSRTLPESSTKEAVSGTDNTGDGGSD